MTRSTLPTGRGLMLRMHLLTCLAPLPALGVLLACLFTLLELTHEQWMWFLAAVGLYTAVFTGPIMLLQRRTVAAVVTWLDRRHETDLAPETTQAAFAACMRFPLRGALIGMLNWLLPTWIVCFAMDLALGALEPLRLRRGPVLRAGCGLPRRRSSCCCCAS